MSNNARSETTVDCPDCNTDHLVEVENGKAKYFCPQGGWLDVRDDDIPKQMTLRKGVRVIVATGVNRDRLLRGTILELGNDIVLVALDAPKGKTLAWPQDLVFCEDGTDLAT